MVHISMAIIYGMKYTHFMLLCYHSYWFMQVMHILYSRLLEWPWANTECPGASQVTLKDMVKISTGTESQQNHQGPVSISEKTSFGKISSSLEAARFVFRIFRSLWNLTGTSAAVLPVCLSNFKAIQQFKVPISWLRDFTRSYEKTSFRILRRGPA